MSALKFQVGELFHGYQIKRVLGHGGMGAVYLVKHPRFDADVALKVMTLDSPDPQELERHRARFRREANTLMRLRSQSIIRVLDFDEHVDPEDGICPYLVMEYFAGADGTRFVRQNPSLERVRHVAIQLADALCTAHEAHILHRDIKPNNILIDGRDGAVLIDFGIAKGDADETLTETNVSVGTLSHMAPEYIAASRSLRPFSHTEQTDLWALGCVLYYLSCHRPAFSSGGAGPGALMQLIVNAPHTPVREIRADASVAWSALIDDLLKKDPSERVKTATELAARLRAIDAVTDPSAPPFEPPLRAAALASTSMKDASNDAPSTPQPPGTASKGEGTSAPEWSGEKEPLPPLDDVTGIETKDQRGRQRGDGEQRSPAQIQRALPEQLHAQTPNAPGDSGTDGSGVWSNPPLPPAVSEAEPGPANAIDPTPIPPAVISEPSASRPLVAVPDPLSTFLGALAHGPANPPASVQPAALHARGVSAPGGSVPGVDAGATPPQSPPQSPPLAVSGADSQQGAIPAPAAAAAASTGAVVAVNAAPGQRSGMSLAHAADPSFVAPLPSFAPTTTEPSPKRAALRALAWPAAAVATVSVVLLVALSLLDGSAGAAHPAATSNAAGATDGQGPGPSALDRAEARSARELEAIKHASATVDPPALAANAAATPLNPSDDPELAAQAAHARYDAEPRAPGPGRVHAAAGSSQAAAVDPVSARFGNRSFNTSAFGGASGGAASSDATTGAAAGTADRPRANAAGARIAVRVDAELASTPSPVIALVTKRTEVAGVVLLPGTQIHGTSSRGAGNRVAVTFAFAVVDGKNVPLHGQAVAPDGRAGIPGQRTLGDGSDVAARALSSAVSAAGSAAAGAVGPAPLSDAVRSASGGVANKSERLGADEDIIVVKRGARFVVYVGG